MKFLDGKDVRLVERYELEPPIPIRWDTAPRRLLLRNGVDVSCRAEIRDISLLGALVVIAGRVDAEAGAVVQIQRGDQTGLVKVRRVTNGFGATFVGVQFVTVGDVLPDLHEIVRELRSGDDTLERVWELAQ